MTINLDAMADQATTPLTAHINRSTGQHSRQMRGHRQAHALDSIHAIACKYDMSDMDVRELCYVADVAYVDLLKNVI